MNRSCICRSSLSARWRSKLWLTDCVQGLETDGIVEVKVDEMYKVFKRGWIYVVGFERRVVLTKEGCIWFELNLNVCLEGCI